MRSIARDLCDAAWSRGFAHAALCFFALFFAGAFVAHRLDGQAGHMATTRPATAYAEPHRVRFVFVAPTASRVALVGDFNGWDTDATRLRREPGEAAWSASVDLAPGWHAYAFVVDGAEWVPDPLAPLAPADGFGTPRSVVVVRGSGT